MRIKEIFSLRGSFTIVFLVIAAAFPLIDSSDGSGGGAQPSKASALNDITIPIVEYNTVLTAG